MLGGSSTWNCKPNAWACGGWRQHPSCPTSYRLAGVLCREQKAEQGEEHTHNWKDSARCKTAVTQTTGFTWKTLLHKEAWLWNGFSDDWKSSCKQKERNIFFPKTDKFAVSVYAFQINKQEPIWCKDLTWKADQLIAFSFSQEQQMLHCSVWILVSNGYWWLDQISLAIEKCYWGPLPCSGPAQQDLACRQHCCMTLRSCTCPLCPVSKTTLTKGQSQAACSLQSPSKTGLQSSFPFQEGQEKHPHTLRHPSLHSSRLHPSKGQMKADKLRQCYKLL